jgi:hypothetical protein
VGSADCDQLLVDAFAAHPHKACQLLDELAVALEIDEVGREPPGFLPTEELAELHVIVQAIAYQ